MTRRLLALTWKEVREHFLVVIGLAATLPFGWGIFALSALASPTTVTYLEAHASFCRWILPMAGLALGNRLVVAELHGRTQRFVESLPLRPWEPLVVKFVLGLGVLEGIALTSLFGTELFALSREPFELGYFVILGARTIVYVVFGWSIFFTMGFFGRVRVPIYIVKILGLILVASTTQLELMHFGPIALVGPEMVTDRTTWPWSEMGIALGIAAVYLVVGAVLVSVREGSVQERLAKRMSQRDLAMVGIALMALLTIWGAFEHEAEPLPYTMTGQVVRSSSLPIAIGFGDPAVEADARLLLTELDHDVGTLASEMQLSALPQMRVVLRRTLGRDTIEPVTLSHADGMLVRANFLSSANPDRHAIGAAVIAGMLDARTRRRARFEPRRWWRDGLSTYWAYDRGALPATRLAQAAWATRARGPDAPRLDHFERLREELGGAVAASLAATGVMAIESAHPGGVVALARISFPLSPTEDVRTSIWERMHPLHAQILEATTLDPIALARAWNDTLRAIRARPEVAAITSALPSAEATVTIERDASGIVSVVTRATISPHTSGLTLSVRHLALGPFDRIVEDYAMPRETVLVPHDGHAEVRLTGRYTAGDRVLIRVDLEGTALDTPMRLAATRLEITAGVPPEAGDTIVSGPLSRTTPAEVTSTSAIGALAP